MLDKIIKNYGLLIYAYIVIIFEIVSFCKYTLSITVEKVVISGISGTIFTMILIVFLEIVKKIGRSNA